MCVNQILVAEAKCDEIVQIYIAHMQSANIQT